MKARRVPMLLSILAMSISVFLFLTLGKIGNTVKDGFTHAISQSDLIVGAKTNPIPFVMASIFSIGSVSTNISTETYKKLKNLPTVEWTIPYSLGDGHKGFRVVGTNNDFFRLYHFRGDAEIEIETGTLPITKIDAVLGADVARELKYKLDQKIIVTHGMAKDQRVLDHADKPFRIVGIMKSTGTALDRSIYIPLGGMEDLHEGPASITAFFLKAKDQNEIPALQSEINNFKKESLVAVSPQSVLSDAWNEISFYNRIFFWASWAILLIGLTAMLIYFFSGVPEHRERLGEVEIPVQSIRHLRTLFLGEAFILLFTAILLGVALAWFGQFLWGPWLAGNFGFYARGAFLTDDLIINLIIFWLIGTVSTLWPALKASRI